MFIEKNDSAGDPIVQYEEIQNFRLKSGDILPSVRLGYCVFGSNPKNPLLILHPALTGSPKAFTNGKPSQGDGWWSMCVGKGKFLDTDRFTILCPDHLGGNGESTSAEELIPYREVLSFADGNALIVEVLKKHDISEVYGIVGGSIGGGQALNWLFQDEIRIQKIFDISGNFCGGPIVDECFGLQTALLWGEGKNIPELKKRVFENTKDMLGISRAFDLVHDHIQHDLNMLEKKFTKEEALKAARKFGFLRFVTPEFYEQKWKGYMSEGGEEYAKEQIESWITYQGDIFPKRFSADALAMLCYMVSKTVPVSAEEIAKYLHEKNVELIGFSVVGDILFDSTIQKRFYKAVESYLAAKGGNPLIDLAHIHFAEDELNGHDHFLTEEFLKSVPMIKGYL